MEEEFTTTAQRHDEIKSAFRHSLCRRVVVVNSGRAVWFVQSAHRALTRPDSPGPLTEMRFSCGIDLHARKLRWRSSLPQRHNDTTKSSRHFDIRCAVVSS